MKWFSWLSLLLVPVWGHGASLIRGPYLQMNTSSNAVVRWRTDLSVTSKVSYGLSPTNLPFSETLTGVRTNHEIQVNGLQSDLTYYYQVEDDASVLAGGDMFHRIRTAPPVGTRGPTKVWVLGDCGTADANQRNVRDAYYAYDSTFETDLVLLLGDNAYFNGTDPQYQGAIFNVYQDMMRHTPFWSTRGNHEQNASVYYHIFNMPTAGEVGGLASGTEAYYSWNHANIHFICLDSYVSDRADSGTMMSWLRNDLAVADAEWVVAFWHHPSYTKGSHNSDTEGRLVDMRQIANPILESNGVDLVLSGHSHSYERSFLIQGHYGVASTYNPALHEVEGGSGRIGFPGDAYDKYGIGAVYITAGSSGKLGGGTLDHPAMFVSYNNLGSVILDVHTNRMDVSFLRETGSVDDWFTIVHPVPSIPIVSHEGGLSGITALGASVEGMLVSTGAAPTMVRVYYGRTDGGTNSGAWEAVEDVGWQPEGSVTASLSGLVPDSMYYYRFHADNAFGGAWAFVSSMFHTKPALPNIVNTPAGARVVATQVVAGSVWRYLDDGSDQGSAWQQPAFDDSGWTSGLAQLGYGDGDEATVIGYGPDANNKYITSYLRHEFVQPVSDIAWTQTLLRLLRDDGAIVYHNGIELVRQNMPAGVVDYLTLSVATMAGAAENEYHASTVSVNHTVSGTNVIAVEVHQRSVTSSDAGMDLEFVSFGIYTNGTGNPTNLTAFSGTFCGDLLETGAAPTAVFVLWDTSDRGANPGDWPNRKALGVNETGTVCGALNRLPPGTNIYFRFFASNAYGSVLAPVTGSGMTLPGTNVASVFGHVVREGDSGLRVVRPRVILNAPCSRDVSVSFSTLAGSAQPGSDYLHSNGVLRIPAGALAGVIPIQVVGDLVDEDRIEFFFLSVSNPVNAVLSNSMAMVYVIDDDDFDSDGDGIEDQWERARFGGLSVADASSDFDGDSFLDVEEYVADTDPLDNTSFLHIQQVEVRNEEHKIFWPSRPGRWYAVQSATNLLPVAPIWSLVQTNIPGTPPLNMYTNPAPDAPRVFYRIYVEIE